MIANGRFTDLYTWGKRSVPPTLAAEIQYQLLPLSLSCEAAQFTLCGSLEPSENLSGDTFDYTLDRDTLRPAPTVSRISTCVLVTVCSCSPTAWSNVMATRSTSPGPSPRSC